MDFTNQIGITNDQVYTNRRDINNLMELLGNFKQQLIQIEARLPPLGVTFVTNPMSTSLDGGGFTIYDVSHLTITGTSDLKGLLNVDEIATFKNNVNITGDTVTTGTVTVGSNATVAGTFYVAGATTLNDTLHVNGDSTCGSTLTVSGATTLNDTLNVAADGTFSNKLNVKGNAVVTGTLNVSAAGTFSNNLTVSGATSLGGTLNVADAATFHEDITVNTATVTITANTTINNWEYATLHITGGATITHNININGNAALTGTLNVSGATTCGSTLNISGATTCGSTLTVTGISTLNDGVNVTGNAALTGTLNVSGATTCGSTLDVSGATNIADPTNSSSQITGALIVAGGVGIGGHLYAGDLDIAHSATFGGSILVSGTSTSTLQGPVITNSSVSIGTTLTVTGDTIINSSTPSTTASNGALTVTGGVGIGENLNVGGTLNVSGATTCGSTLNVSGATTCGGTLTVNGISTFNADVNLVQTLTVGGIAKFNNDLQFSMSTLGNNYYGYIYEQSLGDSLFLDGPAPNDYNKFGEKIQIRSVSSSSASMSLNCYDSGSLSNCARITFRKFPAETGNNGPVNNHTQIRPNDYLGFIDWKANTSSITTTVNDTRLAWMSTKAISTDNTTFGGQITFSTRSASAPGSFNNVLILQDNSSVQVGYTTDAPETAKFFIYNNVSNFDTVKIIDTKTGNIGCTLDLLHHSGSPANSDTITTLNFGGYNDANVEITYGIIRCIAEGVTQTAERGSITFSTKNGSSYSDKMKLDYNGSLLLGDYNSITSNTAPNGRLHIIGNSDNGDEDCMLIIQDLDASSGSIIPAIGFYNSLGVSQGRIRSNDTLGLILSGNGNHNDDLVIRNGKVGISMPDPEEKLHIIDISGISRSAVKLQTLLTTTPLISNCSAVTLGTVRTTGAVQDGDYLGTINIGGGMQAGDTSDYTSLSGSATNAFRMSVVAKGDWANSTDRVCELVIEKRKSALETVMVINKDNKVGFNVTDPKCALHVYNPIGSDATNAQEMETHGVLRLQPHSSNTTNMTFAQVDNGNAMGIQVSNSSQTASWDLCLQPFQGLVGVGTVSPAYRLSVVESVHAANTDTSVVNNAIAGSFGYLETNDIGNEAVDIELQLSRNYTGGQGLNDAAFIRAGKEKKWDASANRNSYLAFGTRASTSLPSERMRISSSGYVGINETNPQRMLQITGDDDIAPTTLLALRNNRPTSSTKQTIVVSFRDVAYTDATLTDINTDFKEMSAIQHTTIARDTTTGLMSSLLFFTTQDNDDDAPLGTIGNKTVCGTYWKTVVAPGMSTSDYPQSNFHIKQSESAGDVSLRIQNTNTDNDSTASIYFTTTSANFDSAFIQCGRANHVIDANGLFLGADSTGARIGIKRNRQMTFGDNVKYDCGYIIPLSSERICIGSGVPGSTGRFLDFNYASNQINPSNGASSTAVNGTISLGNTLARFNTIWVANGLNGASDRKLKTEIEELSDKEKRVAIKAKTLLRKYKWKNEVEQDSENAKIHFGIIAQDLEQAFEEEGLDSSKYNIISKEPSGDGFSYGIYYIELLAFIISAI